MNTTEPLRIGTIVDMGQSRGRYAPPDALHKITHAYQQGDRWLYDMEAVAGSISYAGVPKEFFVTWDKNYTGNNR